jgi:hypothetical protein
VTSVTHVVLVSWKDGHTSAAEETIRHAIRGFAGTIPGIVSIVEGGSTSPEGLEDGHDYGFVVTFDSAEARDSYLVDPRHREVAEEIRSNAEHILVFDI